MKLFWILLRASRGMAVLAVLAGAVSGACGAGLLAVVNGAVTGDGGWPERSLLWAFVLLLLATPLSRLLSDYLLVQLSQKAVYDMRMTLAHRILSTPLRRLEELGPHRLLVTLTDDITSVAVALGDLPTLFVNLTLLAGSIVYLGWLSPRLLLAFVLVMALGIGVYRIAVRVGMRRFRAVREAQDELFFHFRSLTDAAKELKLHDRRRSAFLRLLASSAESLRRLNVGARMAFSAAGNWGATLFFVLIGVLLFVLPRLGRVEAAQTTAVVLVVLYVRLPLQILLNALPQLGRGRIAVEKIEQLGLALLAEPPEVALGAAAGPDPRWRSLDLAGVSHSYRRDGEEREFRLGPLDVTLRPAEIVFLVGGNGSGKTTFAKLLTGLYLPESGAVRLDGVTVTADTLNHYRSHFAAVFSDFFLFDRLLGLEMPELDQQARRYLAELRLDRKVGVQGGVLSTVDLSHGQRKRLALLTAYLEDRPIYVFDEWAADQDPQFKEIFYLQLLPELKRRGKAVLAITHDDRYFDVADRILKLEDGRLVAGGAVPAGAGRLAATRA